LASTESVSAKRNDEATLEGAAPSSAMRAETERFTFSFPDLDGTPVSLDDERFANKVIVVTLGGSWCPNCHDEAMFLVPFHREYRDRGFEIVALMFERHGEFAKAVQAVKRYRQDLGIEFPTLIAGVSDTEDASKKLPSLTAVYGYPTTLFIDKRGQVRKIHTGFSGPATGEDYEEYVKEFAQTINELLAE
jgi:thiol-disulfide isomerase/thioredoxin